MKKPGKRLYAYLVGLLCLGQIVVMLISWIVTAAMPEVFMRSLLSAEGIRWFFGRFQDNMSSSLLVWLVVGSITWGAVRESRILHCSLQIYRQRIALWMVLAELIVFVLVMLMLTLAPHAILLNVMGGLWPSSFSASILPYCCFALTVMSLSFGRMSRQQPNLEATADALTRGIKEAAPLFLLYILAMQLYASIDYLFF